MSLSELFSKARRAVEDAFARKEPLVGVDVGTTSIRVVQFADEAGIRKIVKAAYEPVPAELISAQRASNYVIPKPEIIGDVVAGMFDKLGIDGIRVAASLPSPSVFTKKILVPKVGRSDLRKTIAMESAAFIPFSLDAVYLDYHVLGIKDNQLEVMVVAVKNEIVESYLAAFAGAALEVAVLDVDHFAFQSLVETLRPELTPKVTALLNMGSRYCSLNVVRDGVSLITGDVSIGGKHLTELLAAELGVTAAEAEKLKHGTAVREDLQARLQDITSKYSDNAAIDLNRQISLLWSSAGFDENIEQIVLTGAGSQVLGLVEKIQARTGVPVTICDPMKGFALGVDVPANLEREGARFTVACGLALRSPGDRILPEGI